MRGGTRKDTVQLKESEWKRTFIIYNFVLHLQRKKFLKVSTNFFRQNLPRAAVLGICKGLCKSKLDVFL